MLQQILKDMYIEPELLEALNEDQKKTLFHKMRQEQVRRWKEREEKVEKDEEKEAHHAKAKAKTGQVKSVSWLLGRDGDVQVFVIGETDELKSSKLICTGLGERNTPTQLNTSRIQTTTLKSNLINKASADPMRSGRENHPPKTLTGIQLHLKDNSEEVKTALPPQAVASEAKPSTDSSPESQEDSQSGRTTTVTTASGRPASPPPPVYRPHLRPVSMATTTSALVSPASASTSTVKVPERSIGITTSSTSATNSGRYGSSSSGGGDYSTTSHGGAGYGGSSSSSGSSTISISSSSSSSSISGLGGSRMTITPAGPSSSSSRTPAAQTQESQSSHGKEFRVMAASKRVSLDEIDVSSSSSAATAAIASSPPPPPSSSSTATAPSVAAPPASGPVGRGRVAQLMKTFSVSSDNGSSSSSQAAAPFTRPGAGPAKPAIPSKPSHLRLQQSASLR